MADRVHLWQVTLCDAIWQVTLRSSVMGLPLRATLGLFNLLTFLVIWVESRVKTPDAVLAVSYAQMV